MNAFIIIIFFKPKLLCIFFQKIFCSTYIAHCTGFYVKYHIIVQILSVCHVTRYSWGEWSDSGLGIEACLLDRRTEKTDWSSTLWWVKSDGGHPHWTFSTERHPSWPVRRVGKRVHPRGCLVWGDVYFLKLPPTLPTLSSTLT